MGAHSHTGSMGMTAGGQGSVNELKKEIPNMGNIITLFWSITKLFVNATCRLSFSSEVKPSWINTHNKCQIFQVTSSCVFLISSVFRLGARKQSTQFNNHPGCLNQTREAFLSVYFPGIALHSLFNFMAKWTSLTSCSPPPFICLSHPTLLSPSPSLVSSPVAPSPPSSPPLTDISDHLSSHCSQIDLED